MRGMWYESLEARLILTNLHGWQMLERQIGAGQQSVELSVVGLPTGVYLLRLQTRQDEKVSRKLVISR